MLAERGRSVVRAPDSRSKGPGYNTHCITRSTPVLSQSHVKDAGNSAKGTGGRLQLNTHEPYLYGFE